MMEDTNTPKRRAPRRQAADNTPKLSEYGHVQPQALEFEEAVLGALMIDSDAMGRLHSGHGCRSLAWRILCSGSSGSYGFRGGSEAGEHPRTGNAESLRALNPICPLHFP